VSTFELSAYCSVIIVISGMHH